MLKFLMALTGLVSVPLPYLARLLPKNDSAGPVRNGDGVPPTASVPSHIGSQPILPRHPFRTPITMDLGTIQGLSRKERLCLLEDVLLQHLIVLGGSGTGKSRLLELLGRILLRECCGYLFLDPNGDTTENLLLFALETAAAEGSDAALRQTVYLEPGFEMVFGVDPFTIHLPDELAPAQREAAYFAALHNRADEISEIVQAKQGNTDFAGMARLQRILRDVLIAIGTPVNEDGEHLALSEVFVLLDRHHPRHHQVLALVYPHLPREVQGDFDSLAAYKSEEQRKKEIESTINRLRSLLAPVVQNLFSATRRATLNFKNLIREQKVVLVNLRKTDFLSADQRSAIGMIILHQVLSAAESCRPEERQNYYLFVDEAKLFLSERLCQSLEQFRKFRTGVILAGQSAYQFVRGDINMLPAILDSCGSMVSFQQKYSESLHELKQFFGYANLRFEKFRDIRQRDGGDELLEIPEESFTTGGGTNWSHGEGQQVTVSEEQSASASESWQQTAQNGQVRTSGGSLAEDDSRRRTKTETRASAFNHSQGNSHGGSTSSGTTQGRSSGTNTSDTVGGNDSWSRTVSHKKVLHHRIIEEEYETPQLKDAVADQLDHCAYLIRTMAPRHAMASFFGEPRSVIFKVDDVNDVIADPVERACVLRELKARIYTLHDFYFTPDLSPQASDRRLAAFLERAQSSDEAQLTGVPAEPGNGSMAATRAGRNGKPSGNGHHRVLAKEPGKTEENPLD